MPETVNEPAPLPLGRPEVWGQEKCTHIRVETEVTCLSQLLALLCKFSTSNKPAPSAPLMSNKGDNETFPRSHRSSTQ